MTISGYKLVVETNNVGDAIFVSKSSLYSFALAK